MTFALLGVCPPGSFLMVSAGPASSPADGLLLSGSAPEVNTSVNN